MVVILFSGLENLRRDSVYLSKSISKIGFRIYVFRSYTTKPNSFTLDQKEYLLKYLISSYFVWRFVDDIQFLM